MLLIVGEAIVAYQRDLSTVAAGNSPAGLPFEGPWPSGSPAITAYVAARLGVPTAFVGGVGDDPEGVVMRRGLQEGGVDVSHLHQRRLPTGNGYVTYLAGRDGGRKFDFNVHGSAATAADVEDLGRLPEKTTWLHLSGSTLLFGDPLAATAMTALARAKTGGARISVDVNTRSELLTDGGRADILAAVELADVLLPSRGELESLGLRPAELAARGVVLCATDGANGATLYQDGGPVHIPAYDITAVDPDGAGDSFAAGFIAASMSGATPAQAARFATRVAAEAVSVPGPMTATFARLSLAAALTT